jgi:hypothetical protein
MWIGKYRDRVDRVKAYLITNHHPYQNQLMPPTIPPQSRWCHPKQLVPPNADNDFENRWLFGRAAEHGRVAAWARTGFGRLPMSPTSLSYPFRKSSPALSAI